MRILHVNTNLEGGAAWCAMRINKSLIQNGIESRMLFADGSKIPEGIEGAIAEIDDEIWEHNWLFSKIRRLINRIPWVNDADSFQFRINLASESLPSPLYLHHPFSHYKNISQHELIQWADIIHLHWVADFVDYSSFFKEVKKPIVWTLHDKFPAVGLQHYCCANSVIQDPLKKLDAKCVKIKRQGVVSSTNLSLVAISSQMKDICNDSEVLKGFPCTIIHNGVDCNVFKYVDIDKQCVIPSIPNSRKIFLFSAYYVYDDNKGLQRTIDALESLNELDKTLIVVGNYSDHKQTASFPIIYTGLITDQSKMSELYSISDFTILASYEETFAQTPLESMACGTPVISTPCCGISDLINYQNGVICPGFDADSLAYGIMKAVHLPFNRNAIRQFILDNFDYSIISKRYINLYKSIINNSSSH